MQISTIKQAPEVRADLTQSSGINASQPIADSTSSSAAGTSSRLVQDFLPWVTSVVVHGALIVLGVATATVIIAPPPPLTQEQVSPGETAVHQAPINLTNMLEGQKVHDFTVTQQEVDPAAANGLAKAAGNKLDVDAGGGQGSQGQAADLIAFGSNRFSPGDGTGTSAGGGKGTGKGDGGPLARWGTPQVGGSGMFIVQPEARRIVFICDATGTMIQKLGILKHELTKAIARLKPVQSFNIVFFSDGGKYHIASKDGLMLASPENKRQAYAFLEDITPNGTTDPIPAIAAAFKQNPDLVYFLSDGEFNNLKPYEEVVRQFSASNSERRSRVNAILFETYDREAEQTMQKIAGDSGGTYRFIREADLP